MDDGLCGDKNTTINPLFSEVRCETCRDRVAQVSLYLAWFVLITEHLLILLKVFLMIAIPDKPLWVVRASERRRYAFEKERDPGPGGSSKRVRGAEAEHRSGDARI